MLYSIFASNSAYSCESLLRNHALDKIIYQNDLCINMNDLALGSSYIFIDSSLKKNAAFTATLDTSSGQNLFSQDFSHASGVFNASMNIGDNYSGTDLVLTLTPTTNYRKYTFTVIHDYNPQEDLSVLYVTLISEVYGSNTPPIGGGGLNPQSMNVVLSSTSSNALNVLTEAAQCSDSNRPPTALPVDDSGKALDLNGVLRESAAIRANLTGAGMLNPSNEVAANTYLFLRAYIQHKPGGSLAIGNFVYGANMRGMGFSREQILAISAGIDAATNGSFSWNEKIGHGIMNYITGYGEEAIDVINVTKGMDYYGQ